MSQNYEESPVSDGKMDISEATTSQESTGVSPSGDGDSLPEHQVKPATGFDVIIAANLIESPRKMKTKLCNHDGTYIDSDDVDLSDSTKIDNLLLDNEQSSENVLRLGQYNSNLLRSELTLANSHPLMSPPGTDSDSENGQLYRYKTKNFNFPDVVPVSDQQQHQHTHQQHDHQPQTQIHNSEDLTFNSSRLIGNNTISVNSIKFEEITSTDIATKNSNNTMTFSVVKPRRKIEFLRISSPDNSSSESEPEISQYQAAVDENYQSVALISKNQNRENKLPSPKPLTRRKIPISAELLSDDMSSLDSISNHSFDDDMEPNLASLSPSSSLMDGLNDKDDDYIDIDTPTNVLPSDPIPTYTAKQERRDSRNWQKVTLPDGLTREIDMKVIEPYKRVLSHGGYLKAGGHNAIVMFCACHLPDRSRADYHYVMDNLFLYVVKTLEQLVTDDYVLVYLHGGSNRRNVPPFPWLKKCYQLLDRRLRKSLKNLYLVHPTFWLKSIVWMSRPFISSKFWRKLIYVRTLEKLYSLVSVEKAAIPDKVKCYDSKYA